MQSPPRSIVTKLFVSMLLILIPLIAAGLAILSRGRSSAEAGARSSAADNVSFLTETLETEIEHIRLLQYALSGDTSLQKLLIQSESMAPYEYYEKVGDVQTRLNIIKSSSNYIEDIFLYLPQVRISMSTNRYYRETDTLNYQENLALYQRQSGPMLIENGRLVSLTFYPLGQRGGEDPFYLVKVVLSRKKIGELLEKFNHYSTMDVAFYSYSDDAWIFQNRSSGAVPWERCALVAGSRGQNLDVLTQVDGQDYFIISSYSGYLDAALVQYVPAENIFQSASAYRTLLWVYIGIALAVLLLYAVQIRRYAKRPVETLLGAFSQVENGRLDVAIHTRTAQEFSSLFEGFNSMVRRLDALIYELYQQELCRKDAELKQLQDQINPHFLFNTYYMLRRLIQYGDLDSAQKLCAHLGTYMEYITRNATAEVPLEDELHHAQSYASIQQMRFSRQLRIEMGELPRRWRSRQVPRLILQPLLENAFAYGVRQVEQDGLIRLSFREEGGGLHIVVEDNGGAISDETIAGLTQKLDHAPKDAEITALLNVHRRLRLRFGEESGIFLYRSPLGGLAVDLRIFPEPANAKEDPHVPGTVG